MNHHGTKTKGVTAAQTAYLIKLATVGDIPACFRMRKRLFDLKLIKHGEPRPNGTLPTVLTGLGKMWVKAKTNP